MKFGVVNKSTTVNRFVLHALHRNITHLAITTLETKMKLGILKKGNWKRAIFKNNYFASFHFGKSFLVLSYSTSVLLRALYLQKWLFSSFPPFKFSFDNAMKLGVVNKSTILNRFVLHTLQRNIKHLAVIARK